MSEMTLDQAKERYQVASEAVRATLRTADVMAADALGNQLLDVIAVSDCSLETSTVALVAAVSSMLIAHAPADGFETACDVFLVMLTKIILDKGLVSDLRGMFSEPDAAAQPD